MRTQNSRVLCFASFTVVLLAAAVFAEDNSADSAANVFSDPGDVLMLHHNSFHFTIFEKTEAGAALVLVFCAPWSQICQELMPIYKEAAAELKAENPPIYLAMMDADPMDNRNIALRYGAKGFPTVKVFKNNAATVVDYKGGREKEDIIKLAKASQGYSWTEVFSSSELDEQVAANERVVIFGGREHGRAASSAWKAFQLLADNVQSKQQFKFLAAFKPAVVEAAGIDAPAIQLITNYKGEGITKQVTEPKLNISSVSQVERWLYTRAKPLVANTADPIHASILRDAKIPVLHVILKEGGDRAAATAALTSVAQEIAPLLASPDASRKLLALALTDAADEVGKAVMGEMGVESTALPAIVIRVIRYPLRSSLWQAEANRIDKDAISAFASDFLNSKLNRFIKSDPSPDQTLSKKDPIQRVVGSTFESVVMDPSKHVLLSLYAPWCPHSKRLEPEYRKAAAKFWSMREKKPEKYGNLVIAQMDASANDSPVDHIQAVAYPTIMFVSAGNNTATRYQGPKTALDLIKWAKIQAGLLPEAEKRKEEL